MSDGNRIFEQAAAWHVASAGDDMDWDGFTAWLEADPRHGDAYDQIALGAAMLDDHAATLRAAFSAAEAENEHTPSAPKPRGWRTWGGMAIAASLVAVIAVQSLHDDPASIYATQLTGQHIALADGSTIELAPHSRLAVEDDGRNLSLEGRAYFIIRHDPKRVMMVQAGPVQISDIGTEFDVQTAHQTVRVEVGDGRVAVTSAQLHQPIELGRGGALVLDVTEGTAEISESNTGDAGAWRNGRLVYSDAPLALVAHDLKRFTGLELAIADGVKRQRFSGTLVISDGEKSITDLARIMGLDLRRTDRGYRIDSATR